MKVGEKEEEIHNARSTAAEGNEEYTKCLDDLKQALSEKQELQISMDKLLQAKWAVETESEEKMNEIQSLKDQINTFNE